MLCDDVIVCRSVVYNRNRSHSEEHGRVVRGRLVLSTALSSVTTTATRVLGKKRLTKGEMSYIRVENSLVDEVPAGVSGKLTVVQKRVAADGATTTTRTEIQPMYPWRLKVR